MEPKVEQEPDLVHSPPEASHDCPALHTNERSFLHTACLERRAGVVLTNNELVSGGFMKMCWWKVFGDLVVE